MEEEEAENEEGQEGGEQDVLEEEATVEVPSAAMKRKQESLENHGSPAAPETELKDMTCTNPASLVGSPETEKEVEAITVRKDIARSFFAPKKAVKKADGATLASQQAPTSLAKSGETSLSQANADLKGPAAPVAAGAVKAMDYNPGKAKYVLCVTLKVYPYC